ncbi:hypothetical protein ZEAMMB73_Zm00001d048596 [Zea mays]|uniref:Uncharacterized protein n=1 Tax=Zea mays TaxID=4577 RepID=K7TQ98_MAIZE|nr:hypothetical protein ZEAMMB73_Zm00001d048596 [Zea mays]
MWVFSSCRCRSSTCRRREPPLPHIPRSFLRVRYGRMTVRVVMRYLVNKLGLEDDSQINPKAAESLADPSEYPNLFED